MKARLPQGYGGGGQQNMNHMLKQAQKMQEEMELKQAELAERVFEAKSGGGAVHVKVLGSKEVQSIEIDPEVVDPDDIEMLQDLIIAAVNEAMRTAEEVSGEEMGKITGSMQLPGMPGMF